jgi:diguanylate cyclase (GGDEF)-like protein/PAS domain S-box-containing protein
VTTEQDANKERLELALEAAGLDLWENDLVTGDVTRKARKIFAELGYGEEESLSYMDDIFKIVHPEDVPLIRTAINNHLEGIETQYRCEFRVRSKSGAWVWYANYGKIMDREGDNGGRRFIGVTFNIDDRKRNEEMLAVRGQVWRTLVENSPDTIARYDRECRRIYVNPALSALTEGGTNALLGKKPSEFPGGQDYIVFESKIREVFETGRDVEFELNLTSHTGKKFCTHIRLTAEHDSSGSIVTVMGVGRDISELNMERQKVNEMAFYDSLTGLPNRRLLINRLQRSLATSARSGLNNALIFIDLDNFKTLNDTLGHDVGDLLLREAAQRLTACMRQEDTVARMGGDEFVIILEKLSERVQEAEFQVGAFGRKILAILNQPYQLANHSRHITPSIGIVLFSGNQLSIDELMKRADIAMYQAKKIGRNTIRFFDLDMQTAVENRSSLEESMKQALPLQQFEIHYQPQVNDAGTIVGAEVLLRWQHPVHGTILPADFIPIAEETGLIVDIGLHVLKSACRQLKTWEKDPGKNHLHLSVNISARQFQQADFVEQITGIFESAEINPARMTLEITESMVLDNVHETIKKMHALKEKGVKFAMDDFGTGHSSLSGLKRLPLDQIKIDQSFVHDISENDDAAVIIQTIIAMGNNLGMEVIAEGVETAEQKDFLLQHHCVNFQGYFFGDPMPLDEFERVIAITLPLIRNGSIDALSSPN